jgi:general secretion pathway protein I
VTQRPSRRARLRTVPHGFGLIEAIVALTLLAGTGLALFAWINQSLQSASRLRQHELESRLLLSAQALVDTVNPLLTPTGQLEVNGVAVNWQAEAIEPARDNATFTPGLSGPWRLGLFRLRVEARDSTQGVQLRYEQWRIGSRRLSAPSEALP